MSVPDEFRFFVHFLADRYTPCSRNLLVQDQVP